MFLSTWQAMFRISDVGIRVLYKFFSTFITILASVFHLKKLKELANTLPNNLRNAQKIIGNTSDTFMKYASCPKCNCIYLADTCKIDPLNAALVTS